jgi:murein DD-endopeptidase MepM/ murein hydrolase activator NlpD
MRSGYSTSTGTLPRMRPRSRIARATVAFVVLAIFLAGTPAWSVSKNDVDRACAASSQALRDLENAQAALEQATADLNAVYSRVEQTTADEVTLRETVDVHEAEIRETQDEVVIRAVEVYMGGGNDLQQVFFAADSVNQVLAAQEIVEAAADSDVGAIERLDALTSETERLRGGVLQKRDELRELQGQMEVRAEELESARNRAATAREQLSGRCAELKAQYDAEQAARAAAEAARRRGAAGGAGAIPGFICPVAGPVSFINDWGFPRSGGRTHKGTDMFAARGTPLVAVLDGTVSFGTGSLGGKTVHLRAANGLRFYYAHLDAWAAGISSGQRVSKGTVVGYVGDTGNARGGSPHLHFGITTNQSVNPYPTVKAAC